MSDVSVVVVTFNSAPWIERCLESVRGYETIVVDNGSTDGTVALVRERFPEARVIEQENLGMGGGNNAGMRLASARYFLLLNADAWVLGDGVDQLAHFAELNVTTTTETSDVATVTSPERSDGTNQRREKCAAFFAGSQTSGWCNGGCGTPRALSQRKIARPGSASAMLTTKKRNPVAKASSAPTPS